MSLSLSAIKYAVVFLIGAYLGARFFQPAPEASKITQNQSSNCKAVVKRIVEKDGTVTESATIEAISKQEQKIDKQAGIKTYGIGIYHDKSVMAEARLGKLPLFIILDSDLKNNHKAGIKLEF